MIQSYLNRRTAKDLFSLLGESSTGPILAGRGDREENKKKKQKIESKKEDKCSHQI